MPAASAVVGKRFRRFDSELGARSTRNSELSIHCPYCLNSLETEGQPAPGQDVRCGACGSSFRVDTDHTEIWGGGTMRRKLGRFELLETVGAGAFGIVYKARDPELHRVVAIKVPRAGQLTTGSDVDRFLRESRSLAQLHHPGIVPVFEIGQAEGLPFLVSEFVEGMTLADYLTGRRLGFPEAASLTAAVADALQYAHEQGVVHRDVKPGNVMLQTNGDRRPGRDEPPGSSAATLGRAGSSASSEAAWTPGSSASSDSPHRPPRLGLWEFRPWRSPGLSNASSSYLAGTNRSCHLGDRFLAHSRTTCFFRVTIADQSLREIE